jgi:cell division protease FtsH
MGERTSTVWRQVIVGVLYLAVAVWFVQYVFDRGGVKSSQVSYSELLAAVDRGEVAEVRITERELTATLKKTPEERLVATRLPSIDETQLLARLERKGVKFSGALPASATWIYVLTSLIPFAIIAAIWIFATQRLRKTPVMTFGRNRAKVYDRSKEEQVTFADVAGVDEAEAELAEVIDFLKSPARYSRLGGRMPKGVLLVGPPGTGKTLLARAVAGESRVPFFSISGSEFVEMFVGVGAARVRDLFEQAKENAPCIVFIDELDAVGRSRMAMRGAVLVNDEREQTLNQLLAEMDGFDSSKGVIIMAATNAPEVLDPALLRAGRFDRQIVVDRPDVSGREAILRVHARGKAFAPDVRLEIIAARTPGMAGADLAMTRPEIEDQLAVMMGGRASEELVFEGIVSSGAADDFEKATTLARLMITRFGMDESAGTVTWDPPASRFLESPLFGGTRDYSEETARTIDAACKATLSAAHERATAILTRRRGDLNLVARKLVERETLTREDLDLLLQQKLSA